MTRRSIDATIKERGVDYGEYAGMAELAQGMKDIFRTSRNWSTMSDGQREALDMTAVKIARILNGDPHKADSWHDAQGYLRLGELQCG